MSVNREILQLQAALRAEVKRRKTAEEQLAATETKLRLALGLLRDAQKATTPIAAFLGEP